MYLCSFILFYILSHKPKGGNLTEDPNFSIRFSHCFTSVTCYSRIIGICAIYIGPNSANIILVNPVSSQVNYTVKLPQVIPDTIYFYHVIFNNDSRFQIDGNFTTIECKLITVILNKMMSYIC